MRRAAITLLLLLLAGPAPAADWVRLPLAGEDQYFYDRSKLVIEGEEVTYWKKVVFARPQPVKGRPVAWALMRERIHCGQHTLRLISYLYYAADGTTLEYVPEAEKEGTPIIPDTVGDAFERHLCTLVKARRREGEKAPPESEKTESQTP
ncbi:MAG: hypothetical protein K6T56_09005 [Burkholderiales bacterium]|nr:hypothetical protein [Burkholderiales bacterium]